MAKSSRPHPHQRSLLLAALAVIFLLAACGGDAGQASPPVSLDASDEDAIDNGVQTDGDVDGDTDDSDTDDEPEENDGGAPPADDGSPDPVDLPRSIPPEFDGAVTLMPIGDSITMGRSDRPSWRYPFQNRTREIDCRFDMVGTETNWADGAPTSGYNEYDHNHQSVGGRTTQQSAQAVIPLAPAFQPDLVLMHTGTNDLTKDVPLETTLSELQRMLRSLIDANPEVQIYLAEIIPAGPARADDTAAYNAEVRQVAEDFAASGANISTVDMFTGWDHTTMTVQEENIHPNQQGAEFIADRWVAALQADGLC